MLPSHPPPPIKKGKSMTGYLLFSAEIRKTIQAQNPTSNFGNISKLVGAEWHKLNDVEKKEYDIRAEVLAKEKQELVQNGLSKLLEKRPITQLAPNETTSGALNVLQKYVPNLETTIVHTKNSVQTSSGSVESVEDLFKNQPKYCVIQLEAKHDTVNLFKQLLAFGYKSVRFLDDLTEHPTVKEKIESMKGGPLKALINGNGTMEIPEWNGDVLDNQAPTTFKIQMVEKITTKTPKRNSTGASSTGSISSTDYDQTIEQVIGQSSDPNALVTSLFSSEAPVHIPHKATVSSTHVNNQPGNDELVKCRMCDSMIMATRFSNLTNHVRRHATLKQYQCPHCSYQNNEQAKVRLHMQNQHSDSKTTIIDKISNEMQKMWDKLMGECFPNYSEIIANAKACQARRLAQSVNATMNGTVAETEDHENHSESLLKTMVTTRDVSIYRCIECSHIVPCVSGQEPNREGPLVGHLRNSHYSDCFPWKCDDCGYKNAEQWKVRLHILNRHVSIADKVTVTQMKTQNFPLFIRKFFHNAKNLPKDSEEQEQLDIENLTETSKKRRRTS